MMLGLFALLMAACSHDPYYSSLHVLQIVCAEHGDFIDASGELWDQGIVTEDVTCKDGTTVKIQWTGAHHHDLQ